MSIHQFKYPIVNVHGYEPIKDPLILGWVLKINGSLYVTHI
jgi:hypothetical protein